MVSKTIFRLAFKQASATLFS